MSIDWRKNSKFAHLREHERRLNGIKYLFDAWGVEPTREQVRIYLLETQSIPFWWFRCAIRAVIASHHWAKPPTIAEIRESAEVLAGLQRERYRAGHYLPAECAWPPDGQRYAVNAGEFESSVRDDLEIGPGATAAELPESIEMF